MESYQENGLNKTSENSSIVNFINDLKEAIECTENDNQHGNLEQKKIDYTKLILQSTTETNTMGTATGQINTISSLINVNNLSNQTFVYIMNWLRQQNINYDFKETNSIKMNKQSQNSNNEPQNSNEINMTEYPSHTDMSIKIKELEDENLRLKAKLIELESTIKTQQYNNSGANTKDSDGIYADNENQRLKKVVEELVKANEEKDKKLDELTKQVIRFKRIQEIVLSAQSSVNQSTKTKNLNDLEYDLNIFNTNSEEICSNIAGSANNKQYKQNITQQQLNDNIDQQQQIMINQKVGNVLISSCSLSSSLSSSSSSASSSSIVINNQNNNNINQIAAAPLATISELCSYNSMNPTFTEATNNTNNNTETITDDLIDDIHFNYSTMKAGISNNSENALNCTQTINQNKVNGIKNDHSNITKLSLSSGTKKNVTKKGSICSLNGALQQQITSSVETKYSSTSSINTKLISTLFLNSQNNYKSNGNSKKSTNSSLNVSNSKFNNQPNGSSKIFRNFFGKLMRTSLVNINETNSSILPSNNEIKDESGCTDKQNKIVHNIKVVEESKSSNFKRGGMRSTANARLQNNFSFSNHSISGENNSLILNEKNQSLSIPSHQIFIRNNNNQNELVFTNENKNSFSFAEWSSDQVYDWLRRNGFEAYFPVNSDGVCINKWIKNGLHLLQASQFDYEKELGIKNPLHRKRLTLLLQSLYNSSCSLNTPENYNMSLIDHQWVIKWLDDIGLPQYKDVFHECMIDGLMLHHLSNEDLQALNIHTELHYLSIKRAIHVLRLNNFDPQCLRRRPSGDDLLDKSEVMLWTNHRVMEWLRSIDLSEYAPNLRGSGVHGGLMVFENRFTSTVLADILSIPASKTLLRRHLNSLFIDLIGPSMQKLKKEAEVQPGYQILNASTKVKHSKRNSAVSSIFSHKRTKSQDSRDFLSGPILFFNHQNAQRNLMNANILAPEINDNKSNYQKYNNQNNVLQTKSITNPISGNIDDTNAFNGLNNSSSFCNVNLKIK